MSICLRYTTQREEASSMLNLGFLKICTQLDKYRSTTPFEAWIRRIMINTIIDQYRRDKKRNDHEQSFDFQETPMNHHVDINSAAEYFDAEHLREMIRRLPDISQKVFNMAVVDGYDYNEIAEKLDMTESTCRWHVHFSRKTLKQWIAASMKAASTILL